MASLEECMSPLWKPKLWDKINDIDYLNNTNCYSYAFNHIDYGDEKIQPGELTSSRFKEYTCKGIIQKMKEDYPEIKDSSFHEELNNERYKIALVVDDKDEKDYHFYREDCGKLWSHKPGTNDITREDASGSLIINPEYSDRDYTKGGLDEDEHNYNRFCGYFSYPNKGGGPIVRLNENN